MSLVERWQYPWILVAVLAFSIAIVGHTVYDIGLVSVYPILTGFGLLVVVIRPTLFGHVMIALGGISLIVAFLPGDWGFIGRVVVLFVGLGALASGVRSYRYVAEEKQSR